MRPTALAISVLLVVSLLILPAGHSAEAPVPVPLRRVIDALPMMPAHFPVPTANVGIGPGAEIIIEIPNEGTFACTANFVWTAGGKTYLGSAGHCFLPTGKTATHGPGADYDASGVRVWACHFACGFSSLGGNLVELGQVAYARQRTGSTAVGNDFGVVEIPAAHMGMVHASMPVWGGPTTTTPARAIGPLCHHGNGVAVGEAFPTKGRAGYGLGQNDASGAWEAAIPISSGDSGSALITCGPEGSSGWHGIAPVGIVTHGIGAVVLAIPGYGAGTTIAKAKLMATQAGLSLTLVPAS